MGYKRSQKTPGPGAGSVPGMKNRSYGSAEPTAGKTGRTMSGARGGSSGSGGGNITTQGDKAGGISAGHGRTKSASNRIGSGRQQTVRG